MARSYVEDREIMINKVRFIDNIPDYKGIPGQVLSKTQEGFLIKTQNNFIELVEFQGKLIVGDRLK